MSFYENHVFICTNKKEDNKTCCANHNAADMVSYAKQRAKDLGLNASTRFRISSSGCMGRCAEGPVLVIYPEGHWYTYKNREDIDQILNALAAGVVPVSNRICVEL